jgi:hypothetical protein
LYIKLTDFNSDMLYGKNAADSIYPIVMGLPFLSDGRGQPLACFLPIKKPGLAVASLAISSCPAELASGSQFLYDVIP